MRDLKAVADRYEKKRRASFAVKSIVGPITKTIDAPATAVAAKSGATTVQVVAGGVRCYNCSMFGHMAAQCPKPRRPANGCFQCHEVGHKYAQLSEAPTCSRYTRAYCGRTDV